MKPASPWYQDVGIDNTQPRSRCLGRRMIDRGVVEIEDGRRRSWGARSEHVFSTNMARWQLSPRQMCFMHWSCSEMQRRLFTISTIVRASHTIESDISVSIGRGDECIHVAFSNPRSTEHAFFFLHQKGRQLSNSV